MISVLQKTRHSARQINLAVQYFEQQGRTLLLLGNSVFFLCFCWSTVRMWLGNLEHEQFPSFTSSSPRVRECGFQNPRNFCWWNPESGQLLVESGILGFGIRNPFKSSIQVPLTKTEIHYLESVIHGVESRIQDCLGFPYIGRSS